MRIFGYINLFWLNILGLIVARDQVFIDHKGQSISGYARLISYQDLSFLGLLIALSVVIIITEPELHRSWVYLVLAAPTVFFLTAVFIWIRY